MLTASVIIPVYNSEKTLNRCIESVLKQTFSDFELILIDDGSTDLSSKICDDYACADNRVKVIHKNNNGVSSARNDGIKIAQGKYITFVDSDDYLDLCYLEKSVSLIERYDSAVYICGIILEKWKNSKIAEEKRYGNTMTKKYSAKTLLEANEIDFPLISISGPWCKLFLRHILIENNIFFNEKMSRGEDSDFNLQVIKVVDKFVFDSNFFYHYTFNEGDSLFNSFRYDIYDLTKIVYSNMYSTMIEKQCSEEAIKTFKNMYVGLMIGCIHHYYIYKEKNNNKERKEIIYKVSKDELLFKCKISQIKVMKNRILTFLLKTKLLWCVNLIFNVHYSRRKRMI